MPYIEGLPVLSVGAVMDEGGEMHGLPLERRNDVRLAVVEQRLGDHINFCERDRIDTARRLGRIEAGIVGTLATIVVGGTTVIGILLKIVLHLG